jgi:hypothetical protein
MAVPRTTPDELRAAHDIYRHALRRLTEAGIPFLVGGAYAYERYTGISRFTKDLDIFVCPEDVETVLTLLSAHGFVVERTFTHWLAKARQGEDFLDIIYSSGNGVARVDRSWFDLGVSGEVLGLPARLVAPEEMIWSKSFIMERERFDGADVVHLVRAQSEAIDWPRLVSRFSAYWRVLYAHLVLFGFVYPSERNRIPLWVMEQLADKLALENRVAPTLEPLCQGTVLSREQYLIDIEQWGYHDARIFPRGHLTRDETAAWTAAISEDD